MVEIIKEKLYYGWIIVASAFAVIFFHLSIRGSFAVFLNPMSVDLGWSTATVSLGLSLFMLCYGVTAFFAGNTSSKFGPRPVTIIHGLLLGGGIFLSSYAKVPWQFYLSYGVMGGIGAGALFAPPISMVRNWFLKDLGKALGLSTAGAGLGFMIAPIISMRLIEILSWQQAMKYFGVIVMVGVVVAALFMKASPEEIGLKPLGFEEIEKAKKTGGKDSGLSDFSLTLKQALKTRAFWILSLMWFCSNFAEYIVFSHSINYVTRDLGFDKTTATYIYSVIGACFLLMGIFAGTQVDKLSMKLKDPFKARKYVLASVYTTAIISAIFLNYLKTPGQYLIYCIMFGVPFGIYIPTVAGYVGTTFGRAHMGPIWGLTTSIGVAGGAGLGPYFGGYLRDLTGNYSLSIWVATAFFAITVILCLLVKQPKEIQNGPKSEITT